MPKVTAPTAAEIAVKSKPSAEAKALITPGMTPSEHLHVMEKNKLSFDCVGLLAHGLPPMDAICWACQGCRIVGPKLSMPEMDLVKMLEAWLKNPLPELLAAMSLGLLKVDFTGPGSWSAQAALWMPGALVAAAVIGAILLAAGLKVGVAMPPIPKPRLQLPMMPLSPEMLLQLAMPQIAIPIPVLDQAKLMKLLFPFIDLGKGVALGSIRCS